FGQEEGRCHLLAPKASRILEKKPPCPGLNLPGERSSPRSSANLRSSASCSSSSLPGVSTSTRIRRSPRPPPSKCVTPLPGRLMTCPELVHGRRSMFSAPSRVSKEKEAPSAADVIGTVMVQWRRSEEHTSELQ